MRHLFLAAVFAVVPVVGAVTSASAADVPIYSPPFIDAPEPLPFSSDSGWYLRGDIGYKIYKDPDLSWEYAHSTSGEKIDDTGVIGIGAGYRFNEFLRLDATLDYEWRSDYGGTIHCPGACEQHEGKFSAVTGLLNAYVDLGTYAGLTPYVGGGIGASYLMTDDNSVTWAGGTAPLEGDDSWNFSWALMAGVGYALTDTLTVDLNYRYLNLGDASVRPLAGNGNDHLRYEWNDIAAHEIRVGLRYNLY